MGSGNKRNILRLFAAAVTIALLFAPIAYAHPGGTDSQGGHTDSSTGEYHWHHGYPAHQHYDMDGDGKLDCPYDFKDATVHRSGSSSSGSGTSSRTNTQQVRSETDSMGKKNDFGYWVRTHDMLIGVIVIIVINVISWVAFIKFAN